MPLMPRRIEAIENDLFETRRLLDETEGEDALVMCRWLDLVKEAEDTIEDNEALERVLWPELINKSGKKVNKNG